VADPPAPARGVAGEDALDAELRRLERYSLVVVDDC
jgi:hypothetical protein